MPANIYKLKDGTIVPGVTTICNQLGKGDAITHWAWKLGKEGKDWKEELNNAGDIGTLVHQVILDYWQDETTDLSDCTLGQVGTIEHCMLKFHKWEREQLGLGLHTVLVEQSLISEKLGFGGQPDLFLRISGKHRLIDIKTSNGIYDSYWLQLAGYDILLRESGYKVDEYQILWLPKHDDFACPIRTNLSNEKKIFKHLLEIYRLNKEVKK